MKPDVSPDTSTDFIHPIDTIENIANINDWNFARDEDDEISISITGSWSDYNVAFNWMEDLEALHVVCTFGLKVPDTRQAEVKALIELVNGNLWIGHFDMWKNEGVILFRNSLLLSGGAQVNPQQCDALLRTATDTCDAYYQAFHFVVWAGKKAADALSQVMFQTEGEA